MKKNYFLKKFTKFVALTGILTSVSANGQTTQTFAFTGTQQSFTVPTCVSIISVTLKGAQGGTNAYQNTLGGLGGQAVGILTVTPGDVLNIYVGGTNGYNGGGAAGVNSGCATANGGIGGGASDIRLNGTALANRVVVAGGGGGGGGERVASCGRGAGGGGGGGYYGGGGGAGWLGSTAGGTVASGGSQTAGGTGGTSTYATVNNGFAGALGVGGAGGGEISSSQAGTDNPFPGGPGGGLIGGSGLSIAAGSGSFSGQSGAGGSSYTGTLLSASTTSNVNSGSGVVVISYNPGMIVNLTTTSTLICNGSTVNLSYPGALTYTWSNNSNASNITVSPSTNTTYSVTGTQSGCTYTGVATISVSPGLPTLTLTNSSPTVCLGQSVTLTASGAVTYTWTSGVINGVGFTPSATTVYTVTGTNGCGNTTGTTTVGVGPLPVSMSITPTTVCAGQTATISLSSSATSYTLLPNNSVFTQTSYIVGPSSNVTYSIIGTNNICFGGATASINVLPIPTVNLVSTATSVCEGYTVGMTASGGVTYTWTPGNTNGTTAVFTCTSAGVYSVGATNSVGCSSGTSTFVVTVASPTIIATPSSTLICNGDAATLTANGANTYTWNTGPTSTVIVDNPVTTTVYTVTGANASGCTSQSTVMVNVYTPSVTITGPTVVCYGDPVTLNALGADSYTWNGTFPLQGITLTPSVTSIYTVATETFTDAITCSANTTIQVVVNPTPTLTAAASRTAMCKNETNSLTVSGASTYSWSTGSTSTLVAISPSLITTFIYNVVGTSSAGCTSTAVVQVKVNGCVGIAENSIEGTISIYPNPSNGEFSIKGNEASSLMLYNQLGQLIKTAELTSENNYSVKISGLSRGYYLLSGSNIRTAKIIIE